MNPFAPFLPIARQSLTRPRAGAAALLALGVPKPALWPGFFLSIVLTVLMVEGIAMLDPQTRALPLMIPPILYVIITSVAMALWIGLVTRIGRAMGGRGRYDDFLLMTAFLQVVWLIGQLAGLLVMVAVPLLGALAILGLFVLMIWIHSAYVAEIHGFPSTWTGLAVFALSGLGLVALLFLALTVLGVGFHGGSPNV